MRGRCSFLLAVGLFIALPARLAEAIPAFPGAEGFGATSIGGRGGDVYHVTELADTNTLGTLRHALSTAPSSGRTIVFDVSGNIQLGSDLTINNPRITIAGQTAPGQGITLHGDSVWLEDDDLIVRYIRSRLTSTGGTQDSLSISGGNRIMLDHSSASWSSDEVTSMTKDATDVTIQYGIIAEALNVANHSRASLFRPGDDALANSFNLTVHHSLYAHNNDRNPRFGTYNGKTLNVDFRNNVVFDWKNQATHTGDVTEVVKVNFVGNYYVAGLTTRSDLVANPKIFSAGSNDTTLYRLNNKVDATRDDGLHNGIELASSYGGPYVEVFSPLSFPTVVTQSADDAYDSVLAHVGSFWWDRDPVDDRIVTDVSEISDPDSAVRAMAGLVPNTEADVGGLPVLPVVERPDDWDTDLDGLPNAWELEHGLDPDVASHNGDFDGDGYTNIEEYINYLGAWPAPREITWTAGTNRFALNENWDTWQPSQYDNVLINNGTVAIDTVGQHAGNLLLGNNPGDNATLNISAGWLRVQPQDNGPAEGVVVIGNHAGATATLNLSGGRLVVKTLLKGADDEFDFTGGVLSAEEVGFDLVNNGGTIAPGNSPGDTHVTGNLTINSGTLEIEIASLASFDTVTVTGDVLLDGDLSVQLLEDYQPNSGDSFTILTGNTVDGLFDNLLDGRIGVTNGEGSFLITIGGGQAVLSDFSLGVLTLPGDYNNDGKVSAADFTVWRDNLGAETLVNRDPDNSGPVGIDDFETWKEYYGLSNEGSGSGLAANVPEPATILLAVGMLAFFGRNARMGIGCSETEKSY